MIFLPTWGCCHKYYWMLLGFLFQNSLAKWTRSLETCRSLYGELYLIKLRCKLFYLKKNWGGGDFPPDFNSILYLLNIPQQKRLCRWWHSDMFDFCETRCPAIQRQNLIPQDLHDLYFNIDSLNNPRHNPDECFLGLFQSIWRWEEGQNGCGRVC